MWDFKLLKATQTLEKTMAYMIYRLAMYFVLSLVLIFAILAGTGSGLILDSLFSLSGFFVGVGGIAGFAIFAILFYWFRGSWFFSIRAPHVALLNESLRDAITEQGWSQVAHARSLVRERFSTAAELLVLDKRIKATLACLFRRDSAIAQRLSALDNTIFSKLLSRIAETPATYIHEIIIGYCLHDSSRSASAAAISGLTLFAQNFRRLFHNAISLLAIKYLVTLVIFFLMLSPVRWVDQIIPVEFGYWTFVFAALLTWPVKSALFDPIVVAAMMHVFASVTSGQRIESDWETVLVDHSPEFAGLKKQAEFLETASTKSG